MSLNPWNKRVHCRHSWAVYSFSTDLLSTLLDAEIIEVPVMYGTPLRIANLKNILADHREDASEDASYYLVDNTLPSCALCDPGLLDADIVVENMNLDIINRPVWMIGIPKGSRISKDQIDVLDRHFAPYQLDLNEYEFETALQNHSDKVKHESDLARVTHEFLSCHPAIGYISYVGSKKHSDYPIASTTLRGGFAGYVDFTLRNSQPRSLLTFLDCISSAGMDVEFLSVDQENIDESTIIRLKCSSSSSAFEHLQILERALSDFII